MEAKQIKAYVIKDITQHTRGTESFSADKTIRKILKVSYFYLEFSWSENHNKIKYSKRVSSEFSGSHRVLLEFSKFGSKKLMKPFGSV